MSFDYAPALEELSRHVAFLGKPLPDGWHRIEGDGRAGDPHKWTDQFVTRERFIMWIKTENDKAVSAGGLNDDESGLAENQIPGDDTGSDECLRLLKRIVYSWYGECHLHSLETLAKEHLYKNPPPDVDDWADEFEVEL